MVKTTFGVFPKVRLLHDAAYNVTVETDGEEDIIIFSGTRPGRSARHDRLRPAGHGHRHR